METALPYFDVIIIGAGPIGLACGIEAQKAGLSYIILEKGCLVNSIYNYPLNMTFFSTSERLEIGNIPFVSTNLKPTRSEALEYYRRVASHFNLNIRLFEEVTSSAKDQNIFTVTTTKASYRAQNIVLSTGFYDIPVKLNCTGEDLPKVKHYYFDPHYYAMQNIAVVGAANSAVDVALETYRKGANVTMIIKADAISDRVKYWVRPDIINRIEEGSIKAYFNSEVMAIRGNEIDIKTPDGVLTLANDFVLAMTGYLPDFSFLEKFGISLSLDETFTPNYDEDTMETNVENLYLAGVVCGGMNTHSYFIENSRGHATKIVRAIQHKST